MINHLLKQSGMAVLGLSLLCAAVESHDTYKLYVTHENARFDQIHHAYAQALTHAAQIETVASMIDPEQLAPPVTLKKIQIKKIRLQHQPLSIPQ